MKILAYLFLAAASVGLVASSLRLQAWNETLADALIERDRQAVRLEMKSRDTVKILKLAGELIQLGPVKHGRLKGRLKELPKPEDPCMAELFADLVKTLKTDYVDEADFSRLIGKLERCYAVE